MATDQSGNVFVADYNNNTVRKITPAGLVTTVAGTPGVTGSLDAIGTAAQFNHPYGIAVDSNGNIYVSDIGNYTIRKITAAGVVTTLAGTPGISGNADGPGPSAKFSTPSGVTVDGSGNVFVADIYNNNIRKITPAGVVSTFAGVVYSSGTSDGQGSAARFISPTSLAIDGTGNIYVADPASTRIRKITPSGAVTTLAGSSYGNADGTGTAAQFGQPTGVSVDNGGNVYVADIGC